MIHMISYQDGSWDSWEDDCVLRGSNTLVAGVPVTAMHVARNNTSDNSKLSSLGNYDKLANKVRPESWVEGTSV